MSLPDIGLVGRKRSGKSSVASILHELHGYETLSFADPLRDMARRLNPIIAQRMDGPECIRYLEAEADYGYEMAKEHPEFRGTLQRLGEAARDVLGEDVWVDALRYRWSDADGPIVVPDVRYPNEVEALRRMGFMVLRVERPDLPDDGDTHISETALDGLKVVHTITNDGDLDDLAASVRHALGDGGA